VHDPSRAQHTAPLQVLTVPTAYSSHSQPLDVESHRYCLHEHCEPTSGQSVSAQQRALGRLAPQAVLLVGTVASHEHEDPLTVQNVFVLVPESRVVPASFCVPVKPHSLAHARPAHW